jgi:hypothetical protein
MWAPLSRSRQRMAILPGGHQPAATGGVEQH